MRKACVHPRIIATTLGRTEAGVNAMLSKQNIEFPILRRGNLKYDKAVVAKWREMARAGSSNRAIAEKTGVHEVIICRKFAQELHDELMY